jgi:hypothetical protein
MSRFLRLALLALLTAGAGLRPARAAAPKVKDRARLFSAAAVRQADEQIRAIQHDYHAGVVVETFAKVPFHRDPWRKFRKMSPAAREEFFRKWAQARVPGPESVYLFIFAGPDARHVEVQAGRGLRTQGAFTGADRQEVRDRLTAELNAGHNDAALLASIRLTRALLDTRLGGSVAPRPFDWPAVLAVIVPLAGAWLAAVIVQMLRGSPVRFPYGGVSTVGHGISGNAFAGLAAALREPRPAAAASGVASAPREEAVHEQHF